MRFFQFKPITTGTIHAQVLYLLTFIKDYSLLLLCLSIQTAEWKSSASLNVLAIVQSVIINGGFIGGSVLCAWYIIDGDTIHHRKVTVGDFVLFCTYIVQLYGPLNYFGTYYR